MAYERTPHAPRSDRPYQLCLVVTGDPSQYSSAADTVVDLSTADDVLVALTDAGVGLADLRSRTVVVADGDPVRAATSYSALAGFAGRHLDVATSRGVVHLDRLVTAAASLPDAGPLTQRPEAVHVAVAGAVRAAGVDPAADATQVIDVANAAEPLASITAEDISVLRWARRVTCDAAADATDTLMLIAAVAGLAGRRGDRLPTLVAADGTDADLSAVRADGAGTRAKARPQNAAMVVERVELTERDRRLLTAAEVDPAVALERLGCPTDGSLWSCPRPNSHTHGDATPSMRVSEGKVRCFVDDAEWIDTLRLVAVSCGLTADDAADLILGDPAGFEPHAERIAAERAARAAV